jgi:hypothetical protein
MNNEDMSKKSKNTLKDVSEFLKQKPSTFVDVKKPHRIPENPEGTIEIHTTQDLLKVILDYCDRQHTDTFSLWLDLSEAVIGSGPLEEKSADEIMFLNTVAYLRLKK